MLWGQENTQINGNYLYYWLGSAGDTSGVWSVIGYSAGFSYDVFRGSDGFGVRPVIEISKSLIQ